MKRKVGEIWKEGKVWKIQFPRGIMTVKRKYQAEILSAGWFGTRPGRRET